MYINIPKDAWVR